MLVVVEIGVQRLRVTIWAIKVPSLRISNVGWCRSLFRGSLQLHSLGIHNRLLGFRVHFVTFLERFGIPGKPLW